MTSLLLKKGNLFSCSKTQHGRIIQKMIYFTLGKNSTTHLFLKFTMGSLQGIGNLILFTKFPFNLIILDPRQIADIDSFTL